MDRASSFSHTQFLCSLTILTVGPNLANSYPYVGIALQLLQEAILTPGSYNIHDSNPSVCHFPDWGLYK